jgi:cbb3-type cytochrome oxidase subunit 3
MTKSEEDRYLQVLSWEYETLRQEARDSQLQTLQVIVWGTGLLMAGLAFVIQYLEPRFLFFAMPVAFVLFIVFLGQVVHMYRVGKFLRFVEAKVNAYLARTDSVWQEVCRDMQSSKSKATWEEELKARGFNYDFSMPLSWETWLAKETGRTPLTGHMRWLHMVEAGIFLVVILLCTVLYGILVHSQWYWYFGWSVGFLIFLCIIRHTAKSIGLIV